MYWTTKNGDTIHIKDMDDSHVANTIAMIKRNVNERTFFELLLRGINDIEKDKTKPFKINGDIAQMHHDMMMEQEDYGGPIDEEWLW